MAKLFIAFMTTREAQSVLEKQDHRSSHLVEGTILANYVKANKIKLQDAKQLSEVFLKEDAGLEEELNKILLK
jgi:ABC-type Fe3+ transport system substrate-binding protein